MIGKRVRLEREAQRFEMREEARRVADAGHGVHAPALKVRGADDVIGIEQVVEMRGLRASCR